MDFDGALADQKQAAADQHQILHREGISEKAEEGRDSPVSQ